MGVKISALTAASSFISTDILVGVQSSTTKKYTALQMYSYVVGTLGTVTTGTPTTGDYLLGYRSTDPKRFTLDTVAAYAVASAWSGASTAEAALSGDMLLVKRSTTVYQLDVDKLGTYLLDGIQADVLDIHSLETATLGETDQFLVVQGSTPLKTTLTALETKLWTDFATHVGGITGATEPADGDQLYILQSGTERYCTLMVLASYMATEIGNTVLENAFDSDPIESATDGDLLLVERSGVLKTLDVEDLAVYAQAEMAANLAVTPATGDALPLFQGATTPKTVDLDDLSLYCTETLWTSATATVDAAAADNYLVIGQSGTSKKITLANLETQVITDTKATMLDFSGYGDATLVAGDYLLVNQSGTSKRITLTNLETKLWGDLCTYVAARPDASTLIATDEFLILYNGEAGTPKNATMAEVYTFIVGQAVGSTTITEEPVSNDYFIIARAGDFYRVSLDDITDYVSAEIAVAALDYSALPSEAVLSFNDVAAFQRSGAMYQTTLSLVYFLFSQQIVTGVRTFGADVGLTEASRFAVPWFNTGNSTWEMKGASGLEVYNYIAGKLFDENEVTVPLSADLIPLETGGVQSVITLNTLKDFVSQEFRWTIIDPAAYDNGPTVEYTLVMYDTSDMVVGLPIRFQYSANYYYGIITAVTPSTSITISGAPLPTAALVTEVAIGLPEMIVQRDFVIDLYWDEAAQDLLELDGHYARWNHGKAYLVAFGATQGVADTGVAQPLINVNVNSLGVSTDNSDDGIELSDTPGTWVDNGTNTDTTRYGIEYGYPLEVACTQAGTNGDAACLTVSLVFVLE